MKPLCAQASEIVNAYPLGSVKIWKEREEFYQFAQGQDD
jgi:hypothetical protein